VSAAIDLQWRAGSEASLLCDLLHAALDDLEPIAIHEAESGDRWRVFFRSAPARDRAVAHLRASFSNRLTAIVPVDVEDEEWARRSQAGLRAVRVGRLTIAPPWDASSADAGTLTIVIDPSTGFGTGHHETTRLCLALLQEIDLIGRRVIDVGTGSGVLALAAARLGAAEVVAIDDDPDALRNASENVQFNGAERALSLVHADIAAFSGDPANVVTANLTAAVLTRNAAALAGLVAPNGTLIASGFAPDETEAVTAAFGVSRGESVVRRVEEGAWAAVSITLQRELH
jgi:ribosomal protein L11 methyltransferase